MITFWGHNQAEFNRSVPGYNYYCFAFCSFQRKLIFNEFSHWIYPGFLWLLKKSVTPKGNQRGSKVTQAVLLGARGRSSEAARRSSSLALSLKTLGH